MERIEGPKTLEDYLEVKKTLITVMGSPFADQFVFMDAKEKLEKVEEKIKEIEDGGQPLQEGHEEKADDNA